MPIQQELPQSIPETYVETAEFDIFHDEGIAYTKELEAAGARVEINETAGTFHGYERLEKPEKIDYILASREWRIEKVRLLHEKRNGLFLSDHDPIIADLVLPGKEKENSYAF